VIVLVTTCERCPLVRYRETVDTCGHPGAPRPARLDPDRDRQEWCPLDRGPVTIRVDEQPAVRKRLIDPATVGAGCSGGHPEWRTCERCRP